MSDFPEIIFVRVLRTTSSERFLVQDVANKEVDIAAVDIHYLENQIATATIVVMEEKYFGKAFANRLVETIDLRLLPMACLNDGDLSFTVVEGQVAGQYTNEKQ